MFKKIGFFDFFGRFSVFGFYPEPPDPTVNISFGNFQYSLQRCPKIYLSYILENGNIGNESQLRLAELC